ncbi:hypothetical protein [Shewanella sp. SR44-3]|uniref:hypothetical protein n=1 Tax=Shewanella sp. SR44-3 TaxID=2760936 RepID=UPI0015FB4F42|nr:hypothetical protein [Shewanella sp. SR44-3]MBB1270695.1 hypothetical protein [Shewanella sp. SR44-3]
MLRVMILLVLACVSQSVYSTELIKDYLVNAQVYQWYGDLDASQMWREKYPSAKVDLQEYSQGQPQGQSQGQWQPGAHHILDITPLPENTPFITQVRVTLEFYPQEIHREKVVGYYLQQLLSFDQRSGDFNLSLQRVETESIEQDDFESRFMPSSDSNLIRGFLYRWAQGLDEPETDNLSVWLAQNAKISLAEAQIATIADYQAYLAGLGLTQSRRAMKNLQINPLVATEISDIEAAQNTVGAKAYQVEFEYQWSALNAQGETEMANIGVVIRLTVEQGKVQIQFYQEQYLAPKTDLGAEIRC